MTLVPSDADTPARKEGITVDAFAAVDMRAGTILSAVLNPKARKPAYVLEIDLGTLGRVKSSAQLVDNYQPCDLVGRRVVVVANLPARKVAGVKSEVLILASVCPVSGTRLLDAADGVTNGASIA